MSEDNYKLKYIKYKSKYENIKKKYNIINDINSKIIILPDEYNILISKYKDNFKIYEVDSKNKPISYIKDNYINKETIEDIKMKESEEEQIDIMSKEIISPLEYGILSDSNKSKYEINESDYNKFPNRVVPKNYSKIKTK